MRIYEKQLTPELAKWSWALCRVSRFLLLLHKCICQNASLFYWKLVTECISGSESCIIDAMTNTRSNSLTAPSFECSCINVLLLVWTTSFLPPPGVVVNVQLVSSLSNLCFLDCFFEVQVVLGSKSFVFYIVKKWWLKIVLVPKCVGNKLQVSQKIVLFQWIRFWTFDQMKIFLNWIGMWPFTV